MKKVLTIALLLLSSVFSYAGYRIAFVGDPQVRHERDLDFARRSIYKELMSRWDLDYTIVLGDLVNECPRLIGPSCKLLDSLNTPWARVQGNHDGPTHLRDTSYVLKHTEIRVILMDSNYGYTDEQVAWLDSVVTNSKVQNFIFAAHHPYYSHKRRDVMDTILKKCPKLLVVTAHSHKMCRVQLWEGVQEINASTTCGTWYRGDPDRHGIQDSMQPCGAPRGYFIADFEPDFSYTLEYKCVGRGKRDVASAWSEGNMLYVNVFGGHTDGTLEARIGGKWVTLVNDGTLQAPEAELVIRKNEGVDWGKVCRDIRYIPIKRCGSPHVWGSSLDSPLKARRLKVRYSDPYMKFTRRLKVQSLER